MNIEQIIQKNHPLNKLNTFQVGGPAKYYFEAKDKEGLRNVFDWAENNNIKYYILGGGSNTVIPDKGVDGLVVHIKNDERRLMGERIECGAGAMLSQINNLAQVNKLSGLEWSCGIPRATIGGAIRGSAEAFQARISDIVETVEVYRIKSKRFETLSKRMCEFSYRMSIFKKNNDYIVWKAVLKFTPSDKEAIQSKIEASINFRLSKYPNLPSAGSVFENVDPKIAEKANKSFFDRELKNKIGREGKIGAGLLIDMAGLKGKSIGGIKISLEHANHIVNTGKGTSEEIIMMISYIKQQVRDEFGIQLKEEVSYLGF
jgi:UDP-N-acetylmuramate dehydrogenase